MDCEVGLVFIRIKVPSRCEWRAIIVVRNGMSEEREQAAVVNNANVFAKASGCDEKKDARKKCIL